MQYRAPDRSLLEIAGDIDFNAPAIQVLYSPVTGTPITLTSLQFDGMIPRRWRIVRVLENPPVDAPTWTDTVLRLNGSGNLEDKSNTPLPSAMSAFVDNIKQKFGAYGIPIALIVGAAGVLFVVYKKK